MMYSRLFHVLTFSTSLASAAFLASATIMANPQDGQVVGGSATITTPDAATLLIQQQTNSAIINWKSFNIDAGELTEFKLPDSNGVTLNRVTGDQNPSIIQGTLKSNGTVMVVNPDGILFGENSVVDVGGLLATTSDIDDNEFMAGKRTFNKPGKASASVINEGRITVQDAGIAALVAPGVRNDGIIAAKLGKVTLGAANTFTLDFFGDELIALDLADELEGDVIDVSTGKPLADRVKNGGKISADGGTVALKASTARKVVNSVINNTGVIEANSVGMKNGKIVLSAGTATTKKSGAPVQKVKVSGKLSAAGKANGEKGGEVVVTGEAIEVRSATLDASGANGGGAVLIGGDYLGGKATDAEMAALGINWEAFAIPTATFVSLDDLSTVNADAINEGNGGKVVAWADEALSTKATIVAKGGAVGGNGGFVETSGKLLAVQGAVDASAANGRSGTWLLDPQDIYIDNRATSLDATAYIDNFILGSLTGITIEPLPSLFSAVAINDILTALEAGVNVQVTTRGTSGSDPGDIYFAGNLPKSAGGEATLVLNSANDIFFFPGSMIGADPWAGPLNVHLEARNGGIFAPQLDYFWLNGGYLSLTASDGIEFKTDFDAPDSLFVNIVAPDDNSPSVSNVDIRFDQDVISFTHNWTTATIASNGVRLRDATTSNYTEVNFFGYNVQLADYAVSIDSDHTWSADIDNDKAYGAMQANAVNGKPEITYDGVVTGFGPNPFSYPGIAPVFEADVDNIPNLVNPLACNLLVCFTSGPEGKAWLNTKLNPTLVLADPKPQSLAALTFQLPLVDLGLFGPTAGSTPPIAASVVAPLEFDLSGVGFDTIGRRIDPWSENLDSKNAASAFLPYAYLSDAAYSDVTSVLGWKRVTTWDELLRAQATTSPQDEVNSLIARIKESGFNAVLFEKDNRIVLAFEGSSPSDFAALALDFTDSNIPQAFKGIRSGNQYEFALAISLYALKAFGSKEIILTGHSLGGGLAQYTASELQLKAITFNAAGIKSPASFNNSNIVNVRIVGDPVSSGVLSTENLGSQTYEFAQQNASIVRPLTNHSMTTVVRSLYSTWKN